MFYGGKRRQSEVREDVKAAFFLWGSAQAFSLSCWHNPAVWHVQGMKNIGGILVVELPSQSSFLSHTLSDSLNSTLGIAMRGLRLY